MKESRSLIFITNAYPNPYMPHSAWYLEHHVRILRELGYSVHVFTPGDSRHGRLRSLWKYAVLLKELLTRGMSLDFDFASAHWVFPSGLYAELIARIKKTPFVVTSHGAFVDDYEDYPRLIQALVRHVLRSADCVVAVSEAHKKLIVHISGLEPEHIRVISAGICLEFFLRDKGKARASLGISMDDKVIAFVGDLIPRKGADILLSAASRIADRPWCLLIGGAGPEEEHLKAMVATAGLNDRVHFLGLVPPDMAASILSAADVAVIPSRIEAFGLVAVEAMASGAAVVAAAVDGLQETVKHGQNGLLFSGNNAQSLADCIVQLLDSDDLRSSLVEAGLKDVQQYDMRLQVRKMTQIFDEVLGRAATAK